ncbi:MAG TPA: NlpC/P60 family protein [Candidatus Limnocylindria bacterium]|nr:NlpC/P60 family protein [Candidatus Limnocylindria bacterium]
MAIATQGAPVARRARTGAPTRRLFVLLMAVGMALTMAFAEVTTVAASGTSAEPARGSQAAAILRMVRDAVGHPFRLGTEGPRYFDCSGLVWSVYKRAGAPARIGGVRGTATHYFVWAQRHHKVTRSNPQIGDVIIWGKHGKIHHSGIYIGNGRAISALNPRLGVRNHAVNGIGMRVFGYIHTGISH